MYVTDDALNKNAIIMKNICFIKFQLEHMGCCASVEVVCVL